MPKLKKGPKSLHLGTMCLSPQVFQEANVNKNVQKLDHCTQLQFGTTQEVGLGPHLVHIPTHPLISMSSRALTPSITMGCLA